MGEDSRRPRPRWRDVALVTLVAAVLVTGLVYFGQQMQSSDAPGDTDVATTPSASVTPTPPPSPDVSVEPSGPGGLAAPATVLCWDGRTSSTVGRCGLPQGPEGLAWVFPSFSATQDRCRPASRAPEYAVIASYECFETIGDTPVTITYDQVTDLDATMRWFNTDLDAERTPLPGADGGRLRYTDVTALPVRISGTYLSYPYVVSVFAPTRHLALRAWRSLVQHRPPQSVRGVVRS